MMHPTGRSRIVAPVLLVLLSVVVLAGCSYDQTAVPPEAEVSNPAPGAPADCTTDTSTLASFAPDAAGGSTVDRIRSRGSLIVGVSADTFLMGSRDPETNRIEGFDIDIVKEIARALFGDDFQGGSDIQYRVITAADRIPMLVEGDIDMVARNFTVNCDRWNDIAFSQVYYDATQKILIGKELSDELAAAGESFDVTDLAGLRVCAPLGSTSLVNITDAQPDAIVAPAANHTGCLVAFQQGEVDAITGDDTVLAGLAAQDPLAVVPDQEPLTQEPYGIGVGPDSDDLAAFVNAVLEDMRRSGAWDRAYRRWLAPYLGADAFQPSPVQPYRVAGSGS